MYFRYGTQTGEATYLGVDTRSPGQGVTYQHFANVGYKAAGGQGTTVIGDWSTNTPCKLDNGKTSTTVLTDRVYIAVQGGLGLHRDCLPVVGGRRMPDCVEWWHGRNCM